MADGIKDYSAGKGQNNDDLRAGNDDDGSMLRGNGGNDTLRGGRYDDILIGGEGDDQMFGGAGADQFRFFGNELSGSGDLDRIYDLNFNEGDLITFGYYGSGTFSDAVGANASTDGSGTIVSSYEGIANIIKNGGGLVTYSQKGNTDVLVLNVANGAQVQTIHITGAFSAVDAFFGVPL